MYWFIPVHMYLFIPNVHMYWFILFLSPYSTDKIAYSSSVYTGAGIYVTHSEYISSSAVPNNSIAVVKYSSCYYCRMHFHCYSEASTGAAYIRFPNNYRQYSTSGSYNMRVYQTSPAGVYAYNYRHSSPSYTGVYTCEIPDSRGNTLHFSIVWFTSLPGEYFIPYCSCNC